MTVIENINIAYVSQDLSLLSSADADGTKDLRYLSVFAIDRQADREAVDQMLPPEF